MKQIYKHPTIEVINLILEDAILVASDYIENFLPGNTIGDNIF